MPAIVRHPWIADHGNVKTCVLYMQITGRREMAQAVPGGPGSREPEPTAVPQDHF